MVEYTTIGKHLLVDLFDCQCKAGMLNNTVFLLKIANNIVELSGNTVVDIARHSFKPEGATLVLLLAESHLSIHTYPESKYVSIDIHCCGDKTNPNNALDYIYNTFRPKMIKTAVCMRGMQKEAPMTVMSRLFVIKDEVYTETFITTPVKKTSKKTTKKKTTKKSTKISTKK